MRIGSTPPDPGGPCPPCTRCSPCSQVSLRGVTETVGVPADRPAGRPGRRPHGLGVTGLVPGLVVSLRRSSVPGAALAESAMRISLRLHLG